MLSGHFPVLVPLVQKGSVPGTVLVFVAQFVKPIVECGTVAFTRPEDFFPMGFLNERYVLGSDMKLALVINDACYGARFPGRKPFELLKYGIPASEFLQNSS